MEVFVPDPQYKLTLDRELEINTPHSPEVMLLFAILERAVVDATFQPVHAERYSADSKRYRDDALKWLGLGGHILPLKERGPFSCEWVCEAIGIDIKAVRARVRASIRASKVCKWTKRSNSFKKAS